MSDSAFSWASGAGLELAAQPGEAAERRVGAALGVREEHAEAALAQLGGGGVEGLADRAGTGSPPAASARRAGPGRGVELALAEPSDHVVAQLAAAAHLERDAGGGQRGAQLGRELWISRGSVLPRSSRTCGVATSVDVPVGHGGPGQLEALGQVGRPVVDAGQEVEVQVDVHLSSSFGSRRRGPVTRL